MPPTLVFARFKIEKLQVVLPCPLQEVGRSQCFIAQNGVLFNDKQV